MKRNLFFSIAFSVMSSLLGNAWATEFRSIGTPYWDAGGWHVAIPSFGTGTTLDQCKRLYRQAEIQLNQNGKTIIGSLPCNDQTLRIVPDEPDERIHTGSFSARIDFR